MKPVEQLVTPQGFGKHNEFMVIEQCEWDGLTSFYVWTPDTWNAWRKNDEDVKQYRSAAFIVRPKLNPAL